MREAGAAGEGAQLITIGVDAHKGVHVAVAVDAAGREVARWRGPNSAAGGRELAAWAGALGDARRWGIEGAWNDGRGLAQHLVDAGEAVDEVNPRWTAGGRRAARRRDKSDRLDARAVALLVWREAATLPAVAAEDDTVVLELLVTEREDALAEATRLRNQVHQLLVQRDPEYKRHLPTLTSQAGLRAVEAYVTTAAGPVQQQRAAAVRRLAQRLRLALAQAKELAAQIGALAARRYAPLAE